MINFEIDAIIEIPLGGKYKYEIDKNTNLLVIDRPLQFSIPYNYGYICSTLHEGDGDPLDVCIVDFDPIYPLTRVKLTLLGALVCTDNDRSDDKLIAVVKGNEHLYTGLFLDVRIEEIRNYLSIYKEGFVVEKFVDAEEAQKILMKDVEAYVNQQ